MRYGSDPPTQTIIVGYCDADRTDNAYARCPLGIGAGIAAVDREVEQNLSRRMDGCDYVAAPSGDRRRGRPSRLG
jgi:hypothetical protein